MREYCDRRAVEDDDRYEGTGRFARQRRPAWRKLLDELADVLRSLPPARTLDVACGTGVATGWLASELTGLDQSSRMLRVAARRLPDARLARRDAPALPLGDGAFELVATTSFDGHLRRFERTRFFAEARRVAPELVVVDATLRDDVEPAEWQERVLDDGSRWRDKRHSTPERLLEELGGGEMLSAGRWFVAVRSPRA